MLSEKVTLLPVPHVAPLKTSAMPTQRSPFFPKEFSNAQENLTVTAVALSQLHPVLAEMASSNPSLNGCSMLPMTYAQPTAFRTGPGDGIQAAVGNPSVSPSLPTPSTGADALPDGAEHRGKP